MKIAILGAGLCGLEIGRQLNELRKDFIILEKEANVGGLCRTNRTGDYYWDYGVHAMYSSEDRISEYFNSLQIKCNRLKREVKIFFPANGKGQLFINYPFETGIADLPFRYRLDCIRGHLTARAKGRKKYTNLEDWINNYLGEGIARHFMTEYNQKIWSCKLSEISDEIISSRVDLISLPDLLSALLKKHKIGRAYQAEFLYPKMGIQQLVDFTAQGIKDRIWLNCNVKKLVRQGNGWQVVAADGNKIEADLVISTIPLVELLKMIDIDGVDKVYDELKWNNTCFVMIGLKRGVDLGPIRDCQWVFFKNKEVFYRITLMHNFDLEFPPCIVAEITLNNGLLDLRRGNLEELVIEDLAGLGIIPTAEHVALTDIRTIHYTYPIPTVGLNKLKEGLAPTLERNNLYILGRSGRWDYLNMDGVLSSVWNFLSFKLLKMYG